LRGISVQGDHLALRWLVLVVFLLSGLGSISSSRAEDHSVTLLAAGDIARCGTGGAYATAKLLDRLPGVILALGDLAFESGSSDEYRNCYEPTWESANEESVRSEVEAEGEDRIRALRGSSSGSCLGGHPENIGENVRSRTHMCTDVGNAKERYVWSNRSAV
jgi:hypothetical protein